MAELGQQTVDFSALVGRAAEESFLSLTELVEKAKSPELSDTDKKLSLLKYVVKTQQRMLRLNALAKWCKQVLSFLMLVKVCFFYCFWGNLKLKVRSFLELGVVSTIRLFTDWEWNWKLLLCDFDVVFVVVLSAKAFSNKSIDASQTYVFLIATVWSYVFLLL